MPLISTYLASKPTDFLSSTKEQPFREPYCTNTSSPSLLRLFVQYQTNTLNLSFIIKESLRKYAYHNAIEFLGGSDQRHGRCAPTYRAYSKLNHNSLFQ